MRYVKDFSVQRYYQHGSCNHWPVGQAACDGRTVQAADRPTHFMGFPISSPPVHDADGRSWWNGLYGMFAGEKETLVTIARSWVQAPELVVKSKGFRSEGFDRAQRAYRIICENPGKAKVLECRIDASDESPIYNLPIVVENWRQGDFKLTVNGTAVKRGRDFRLGYRHMVDSTNVIVWLNRKSTATLVVKLTLK
jgi:hypothetical protein